MKALLISIIKEVFLSQKHQVVENELADNKYSEYLMKLFKNRDLQSNKDKKADEASDGKTDAGR